MALLTLTGMEIILGIDNVVFIAILTSRLPGSRQESARRVGLALATFTRLGLLFSVSWMMGLTEPLFSILGKGFSGRDLILLGGGLFLVGKATFEIHEKIEASALPADKVVGKATFSAVIAQILVVDLIFSLDSVITAVGMANSVWIMAVATVLAIGVMIVFAGTVSAFIDRHPTMKVLALSFLILIGVMLTAEGLGQHISKGYIYFAMAFSLGVEMINLRMRKGHTSPKVG
ncbi:MAG: TerC family protein [Deltaproteobacteria bacterium]|nr:TerC family protein [Deltaproteobacteria bacterium]